MTGGLEHELLGNATNIDLKPKTLEIAVNQLMIQILSYASASEPCFFNQSDADPEFCRPPGRGDSTRASTQDQIVEVLCHGYRRHLGKNLEMEELNSVSVDFR